MWRFLGFPAYGLGPFERWGVPTSVALLTGFILVCAAAVSVGAMLWSGRPAGPWLAPGLLPLELIYWVGFALPLGPVLGLLRTALVIMALIGR